MAANFTLLPLLFTPIPLVSVFFALSKLRPLGRVTETDFNPAALVPALTVKLSFGLRLSSPPSATDLALGFVAAPDTFQEKWVEPVLSAVSLAVTVTEFVCPFAGLPEITRAELMLNPAGKPVALKVSGRPAESVP